MAESRTAALDGIITVYRAKFNTEVSNDPILKPLTADSNLKKTAPVKILGERERFCKFLI